ncbi:hypothetical protein C7S17_1777 [Burkholderia thailandensis]|nr:hypothetical protein [Burkholderia thailandensis]
MAEQETKIVVTGHQLPSAMHMPSRLFSALNRIEKSCAELMPHQA